MLLLQRLSWTLVLFQGLSGSTLDCTTQAHLPNRSCTSRTENATASTGDHHTGEELREVLRGMSKAAPQSQPMTLRQALGKSDAPDAWDWADSRNRALAAGSTHADESHGPREAHQGTGHRTGHQTPETDADESTPTAGLGVELEFELHELMYAPLSQEDGSTSCASLSEEWAQEEDSPPCGILLQEEDSPPIRNDDRNQRARRTVPVTEFFRPAGHPHRALDMNTDQQPKEHPTSSKVSEHAQEIDDDKDLLSLLHSSARSVSDEALWPPVAKAMERMHPKVFGKFSNDGKATGKKRPISAVTPTDAVIVIDKDESGNDDAPSLPLIPTGSEFWAEYWMRSRFFLLQDLKRDAI